MASAGCGLHHPSFGARWRQRSAERPLFWRTRPAARSMKVPCRQSLRMAAAVCYIH